MTSDTLLPVHDDETSSSDDGDRWRQRWAAYRFPLLAYAAPVALTVLATLTWFSWGKFGASGDIPPFVRDSLAGELTGSWSHQATGAGSNPATILQLVEVALIRGVALVGLGAPVAQWLLYAGCFALCTFGAAYLAGAWVRRPVAIAAAGLLASFNVYILVWLPNPLPPLAIGLAGLLCGMIARVASGQRRVSPVALAAATVPSAYVALNPPWLLVTIVSVLFVAVGATLVGEGRAARRTVLLLIRSVPWVVLFNLWWVVPFAQQLLFPAGQAFAAVTDIRDWAWTHSRNSVANVISLNANWAWNAPNLLTYSAALGSGLRGKLHWMFPLLALVGVVLASGRRRRRAAWLIAGVGVVLLFLSTGVRSSRFGWVNLWLFDHVPGMWVIRDPSSKLSVPIVLIYTSLAAIAIDRTVELAPRLATVAWPGRLRALRRVPPRMATALPQVAIAGVALGALAYPSPMWTGSAFPDQAHGEFPASRVTIPAEWYRLADAVNSAGGSGKIVTLPINVRLYMVGTTWGYHGVDNIPAQLFKRPTLHLMPSGYYDDLPTVKALLGRVQAASLAGDQESLHGALRALGADTVVVRHDLKPIPSADGPITADPAKLDAGLSRIAGIRQAGRFEVGTLYQVAESAGRVLATGRITGVQGPDAEAQMAAATALPDGEVASTDPGQPVDAFVGSAADSSDLTFTLAAGGQYRFDRTGPEASYRVTVADGQLTFTDADTVAVDGQSLPSRPARQVKLSDPAVLGIDVDGTLQPLAADGLTVPTGPGAAVTAYAAEPGDGLTGPFRAAGDCNGYSDARPGDDPLRLAIRSGRVCTEAPVRLTGAGVYQVRFQVRNEGRATPRMCLWQDGPAECATLPAPPTGSAWSDYTAVTRMSPDVMSARLYLYGESVDGPGVAEFRNVEVTPLRPVGSATLTPAPAPPATVALSAGRHTMTVTRQAAKPSGAPEYGVCTYPDLRALDRYPTGNRMSVQPDGTQEMGGPYTLCAQADTVPVIPGATYRYSADYLSRYGQTPHACVWMDGADRCADTPALVRGTGWQTTSSLIRPPAGVKSLTPQVHSFSSDMVPSRVAYRNVSLRRVTLVSVRATPVDLAVPPTPRVDATVVSASAYRAQVRGAAGRFILVHPESYATGWNLTGLPRGWTAKHITVDGYANAWLIHGTGDADLAITYGPSRWSHAALLISALAAVGVLGVVAGRQVARYRRERQHTEPEAEAS